MFKKKKELTPEQVEEIRTKDFFDLIAPSVIKVFSDHYIVGDSYRCVWAVREYPPSTEEQAILSQLADRNGVTLRIYHRLVESMEQRKIIQNATRRNQMKSGGTDMNDTIEAEGNLQDVVEMLANLRKNKEPLLHCAVYIELKAKSMDELRELQSEIQMELTRSKVVVDRLSLRQLDGFKSVMPTGSNQFGAQYERVLPASSVSNLYPFNFSGKTDPKGIYIGRDKFGTNILVDFDRRAEDKTTSNILILGNSGQGKSYLMKLILTNIRESGKRVICFEPYWRVYIRDRFLHSSGDIEVVSVGYDEYSSNIKCVEEADIIVVCLNFDELYPNVSSDVSSGRVTYKDVENDCIHKCKDLYSYIKSRSNAPIIWFGFEDYYCHQSRIYGSTIAFEGIVDRLNLVLNELLKEDKFIDFKRLIANVGTDKTYDIKGKYRWNALYSKELISVIADEVYKQHLISVGDTKKCLILDCDNVLWGGVLSEDGIEGIQIGSSGLGRQFQDFQRYLLDLYYHGVILAVSSKNNNTDVLRVFREHTGMLLKEEYVACFKCNWENKPDNIRNISENLNIGIDSIVFVDDSVFEIESVKANHTILRKAFNQAYKDDYLESNPFDKVDRPRKNKFIGSNYSEEEWKRLLDLAKSDNMYPPIVLAACMGLRRSEALGVRWSRINWNESTILLDTKIVEYKEDGVTKIIPVEEMKNKSSRRTLYLPPMVIEMLKEEKAKQDLYQNIFKGSYSMEYEDYVCVNQLGKLMTPSYITSHFSLLLNKLGMRHIRFHDLRHTFASILINKQVPLINVSNFLGHSDISTTANIYAHLDASSKKETASVITSVFTEGN